ncbi:MAG: hypothetical protein P8L47_03460, partial [Candidatus Marinamargulisbacteria bacterium]|nr:hypothetical protein [Candidatus Marinamargulisbacteria bacterium]
MPVNFYTMGYRPSSGHPHTQAPSIGYPLPLNQGPFQPLPVNGFAETVGKEAYYSASANTGRKRKLPPLKDRLKDRLLDPHPEKKEILDLINKINSEELNRTPYQLDTSVKTTGITYLALALFKNLDEEIIEALARKCDVNTALSPHHDTALTLAILNRYPTAGILALIKAMTPDQLNHVTTNGHSALQLALHINPDEEIIKALASKCNVNKALSPYHDTALTLAILNQSPKAGILA